MPTLSIKRLFDLQELDLQAASYQKSLAEVRATLSDDSAVAAAQALKEKAESQLSDETAARRQIESAVQRLNERLQAAERRLYGGGVTNARELSASEEERAAIVAERAEVEDKLLGLMVGIDELEAMRDGAKGELAQLETQRIEDHPRLRKEEKRLVMEVDRLRQSRESMLPELPPSALALYETIRATRHGQAVAKVERGMCQGCRIVLPETERRQARSGQSIVQCSSCQRILYTV